MMIDEAFTLAGLGWNIFPLVGKHPLTRHGFKDASCDEKTVYEWWHRWPDANIGIALPPSLLVIDLDPRAGGAESMGELGRTHGPIPETRTSISGRGDGGCHYYLLRPKGAFTSTNLPPGVDYREGGKHYVVAPPSIHPDTGKPYRWANSAPFAECPRWLVDMLRRPIEPPRPLAPTGSGDGTGIIRHVAELQEGNRNHGFYWACCAALSDGIYEGIREDLKAAARAAGLTEHEVEATAASAERRFR